MERRNFLKTTGIVGALSTISHKSFSSINSIEQGANEDNLILQSKQFYSISNRHQNECYNPVAESVSGGKALVYLKVENKRESLVFRQSPNDEEIILSTNAYIFNPIITKNFIFWIESSDNKNWDIRSVKRESMASQTKEKPFQHEGRPLSLFAYSQGDEDYLVWEERIGKKTKIKYATVNEKRISEVYSLTDGVYNAYDPVITISTDGLLYAAYTAFYKGNYRILVQKITKDGQLTGKPFLFSDGEFACMYPSICARKEGGVWISYTHFDNIQTGNSLALVNHERHTAQRNLFQAHGSLRVGVYHEDKTLAVIAPSSPNQKQGGVAAMIVYGAENCGKSQLFEDERGRLRLLFRQHQNVGDIQYNGQNKFLKRSEVKTNENSNQNYSDLSLITLNDFGWSKPVRLVQHAHFELIPSLNIDNNFLSVAFMEDSRCTGWHANGEYFNGEGQTGLGIVRIALEDLEKPMLEFLPFRSRPATGPSIENPVLEAEKGEYIFAMGQTHKHTNSSICQREFDRDHHINYRFMQDVQHSDFGCITDHAFNLWWTEMLWMRKLAEYYYFPGEFVAFQAYEWTGSDVKSCSHEGGPFGHANPLFLEEEGDMEIYSPADPECDGSSLPRLAKTYRQQKIIAPPHHPADNLHAFHWNFFDEKLMPIVEIFQDHRGSHEYATTPGVTNFFHRETGHWALDALRDGKKFGFIASADHGGIARAGALVKTLTRNGLYEAFAARRSFGTTGLSLKLSFTCNGEQMGQEVNCKRASFKLNLASIYPVREVQIVRNGEDVSVQNVGQKNFEHHWTADKKESGEFWYCRIIFGNGEMAWSSPVWLV